MPIILIQGHFIYTNANHCTLYTVYIIRIAQCTLNTWNKRCETIAPYHAIPYTMSYQQFQSSRLTLALRTREKK